MITDESNNADEGQSRAGEAGANLTAVLGRAVASFNSMTIASAIANKAALRFVDAWLDTAQKVYLLEHKRLPGGVGSARVRKKRRKALLDWLEKRFDLAPNA